MFSNLRSALTQFAFTKKVFEKAINEAHDTGYASGMRQGRLLERLDRQIHNALSMSKPRLEERIVADRRVKPDVCHHPEVRPTGWNQSRPEPCEMVQTCECGKIQSCPVCGWGKGSWPCGCHKERMGENGRIL